MGFALPAGVVNTDSVYFYADTTLKFGPYVKEPTEQTLVSIDYSQLPGAITLGSYNFTVDVSSNPQLVLAYPQVDQTGSVMTFLLSGGIPGQQYNISIALIGRTDVLTISIPSSGDCDCAFINPVPPLYTQLPAGTNGYVNTGTRYFWGVAPPSNPNIMDEWYDPNADTLYQWITNGLTSYWEPIAAGDDITDAPQDQVYYSRYMGTWAPNAIQADAPMDDQPYVRDMGRWLPLGPVVPEAPSTSQLFGRFNRVWQLVPIQQDAPNDGNAYSRINGGWAETSAFFPDAPSTGLLYGRIDTNWEPMPIQDDAPADGHFYARNNYGWLPIVTEGIDDAPNDGTLYGRQSQAWVAAYPAGNPAGYQTAGQVTAALSNYYLLSNPANYQTLAQVTAQVATRMPLAGGTFTGGVGFNAGAIFPNGPVTLQIAGGQPGQMLVASNTSSVLRWQDPIEEFPDAPADGNTYGRNDNAWVPVSGGGGGIPEAPTDGQLYGRENATWVVVPTGGGGGISDAPNNGTTYARNSGAWQHLVHTDITDWTGATSNFYSASNPAGYQTAAQVTAALVPYYPVSNPAGYIEDAPTDGPAYAREGGFWTSSPTFTPNVGISGGGQSSPSYLNFYPDDGFSSGVVVWEPNNTGSWILDFFGNNGTVDLSHNEIAGNVNLEFWTADAAAGTFTFGVPVTLAGDPVNPLDAATKQYVDNRASIGEAPTDGAAYMRSMSGWTSGGRVGSLQVSNANPVLSINRLNSAQATTLLWSRTNISEFSISFASDTAEFGCYDTSGNYAFSAMNIARGSGLITVMANPTAALGIATKQYVDAGDAATSGALSSYLPLTGGTLTGGLTVSSTTGIAALSLRKAAGAFSNQIVGYSGAAANIRWNMQLGDPTAESGSNAGSNFAISRYSDANAFIDAPLAISRATGAVNIGTGGLTSAGNLTLSGAASTANFAYWLNAQGARLNINVTQPTIQFGYNAGAWIANLVNSYSVGSPYLTLINTIGYNGTTGCAMWYNGGSVTWSGTASDPRLKSAISNAGRDALAAINSLQVYEYDMNYETESHHWNWGLMATEELGEAIPASYIPAVETDQGTVYASLNPLPLIGALFKAVQQLTARIEQLEAI